MQNLRYYLIVALLSVVVVPAAHAAVSLAFADTDLTNNGSANVLPNGTFIVRLNLSSAAADQPVGIDYFLSMLGSGSGLFRIQDRNTTPPTTTPPTPGWFTDEHDTDAVVEALPSALLNPQNDDDLGGTVEGPPPGAGTQHFVAFYTIKVDAATPFGVYSLQSISDPGEGWTDQNFMDHEFAQHANYTIVVVPEPTGLAGCGVLCLLLGRRRTRA